MKNVCVREDYLKCILVLQKKNDSVRSIDIAEEMGVTKPSVCNAMKKLRKDFKKVSAKSDMRGYRDIYKDVGFLHKLMIKFCDSLVKMVIVKIEFKG